MGGGADGEEGGAVLGGGWVSCGGGGGDGGVVGEYSSWWFLDGVVLGQANDDGQDENYGEAGAAAASGEKGAKGEGKSAWAVLADPRVLSLGLCSTIFEGSMYLFVFFWAPALRSMAATTATLPYGVIFAAFMAATLASSLAFGIITARKMASYMSLLLCVLGASSICFLLSSRPASEQSAFWVFCAFEAAVGMYFPSMGYMKGRLVDDGVRAQVYGMLRVPLNVFVVASLMLTRNGAGFEGVFFVCSSLLMLACSALWLTTVGQGTSQAA